MGKYPIVHEYDDYYGVELDDGSVYIQRKEAMQATDRELSPHEVIIVELCEKILGKD